MTGRRRGRGEGTISKRRDGRWMGRVDLGWKNGVRWRKTVYGRTRREVADKIHDVQAKRLRGQEVFDARVTVGDWLTHWLHAIVQPRVRPATLASYATMVRLHVRPHLGHLRLPELGPEHVRIWLIKLQKNGASTSLARYARVVLRSALNDALADPRRLVTLNAAQIAKQPNASMEAALQKLKHEPLNKEQARRLLAQVKGDRLEALIVVAMICGLRQGEALGLQWTDVDLAARELRVRHQLQHLDGQFVLVAPKSNKSVRTVALLQVVVDAFTAHRARQREERLRVGGNWHVSDFVFTTPYGEPLPRYHLVHRFRRLLTRADLPQIRFHDLRHTAATLLLEAGVPLSTVSAILGHSGIQITADTYGHVLTSMKHTAARMMEQALGR